ncbi:FecR family protein [Algoriphagus sp. Y33]|uniref:FecR family protein n=1 Tax=Algoriphagus sp. Y33 TaxID=2772483 RepID=UPI00177D15C4|nr:FecR domain-containing protein [Algoriphagus sp. Y33]
MEEHKIINYLKGKASIQEEQEFRRWLEEPGSKRHFEEVLEKYWRLTSSSTIDDVNYYEILNSIHNRIEMSTPQRKYEKKALLFKSLRVAASVLLILFCSYVLIDSFKEKGSIKTDQLQLQVTSTTRTTGPGEKLTLIMSDKTKVVVNSDSEISFTSEYGIKDRVIHLKGEAFFEVASDPNKPFKVISEETTTKALGTQFNVYSRDQSHRIALVEGKVAVINRSNQIELTPGLMASWNPKAKVEEGISVHAFDIENVTAWKENKLVFDKKPFADILEDLSHWYSVDFEIDNGVDVNKKVIGSFQNKNLKDLLTGLGFSLNFDFAIDQNRVHIKKTIP